MKKIEVDCGFKYVDNNGDITYESDNTMNGHVYVDIKAFNSGEGICFMSEYEFEDYEDNGKKEPNKYGLTRDDLLEEVFVIYELNKKKDKKIAEIIALDFLEWSAREGWCCAETLFREWCLDFDYDEVSSYVKENGVV